MPWRRVASAASFSGGSMPRARMKASSSGRIQPGPTSVSSGRSRARQRRWASRRRSISSTPGPASPRSTARSSACRRKWIASREGSTDRSTNRGAAAARRRRSSSHSSTAGIFPFSRLAIIACDFLSAALTRGSLSFGTLEASSDSAWARMPLASSDVAGPPELEPDGVEDGPAVHPPARVRQLQLGRGAVAEAGDEVVEGGGRRRAGPAEIADRVVALQRRLDPLLADDLGQLPDGPARLGALVAAQGDVEPVAEVAGRVAGPGRQHLAHRLEESAAQTGTGHQGDPAVDLEVVEAAEPGGEIVRRTGRRDLRRAGRRGSRRGRCSTSAVDTAGQAERPGGHLEAGDGLGQPGLGGRLRGRCRRGRPRARRTAGTSPAGSCRGWPRPARPAGRR